MKHVTRFINRRASMPRVYTPLKSRGSQICRLHCHDGVSKYGVSSGEFDDEDKKSENKNLKASDESWTSG